MRGGIMMNRTVYKGTSLDEFLRIKNILEKNGVGYTEDNQKNSKTPLFLLQLLTKSNATYGLHGERDIEYNLSVDEKDYEHVKQLKL